MDSATREWVEKAEGDWRSAGREQRARKFPNYDLACFCAQQCAEKYFKALLQAGGRPVPKVHDLTKLLDLMKIAYPELELLRPQARVLTSHAVEVRYPGSSATKAIARESLADCTLFREAAPMMLGLPGNGGKKRRARSWRAKRGRADS